MQDSKILVVVIAGTVLFLLMGLLIIIILLLYQRRHFSHLKEKELLRTQFAQALLQSKIEIQEQTLRHISREIHDNLGHCASLIKINLNTIDLSAADQQTAEKIEGAKELTRQLITDLKLISVSLSDDRLAQKGFIRAVEMEVIRLNNTGLFTASLLADEDFPEIEKDKALILYRMVQEVINNIMKHSGATAIAIRFYRIEKSIILELHDNGKGFDAEKLLHNEGSGFTNLKHRAELINSIIEIQSADGKGTTVTIKLL